MVTECELEGMALLEHRKRHWGEREQPYVLGRTALRND